jgi:hypothetical protein
MSPYRALLARLAVAAGVLLTLELAFRAGIWEFVARPESHAGTSITLKRAVARLGRPVDFVSLGNSTAQYGFDHAQFAAAAAESGYTHVNLTMGGSHWLTLGVLVDWLEREHPELKGGVLATSVAAFQEAGAGAYELGIVYPFKRLGDQGRLSRHVPFSRADLASYGAYSALFQWRADVLDLVAHPLERRHALRSERLPASRWLFDVPALAHTVCAVPMDTVEACSSHQAANPQDALVVTLCRQFGAVRAARPGAGGPAAGATPAPTEPELAWLKAQRVQQVKAIGWERRPLVVLMPLHHLLLDQISPVGAHARALSLLQPLVDEGRIELLDYTSLFDVPGGSDCRAFSDLLHLSAFGRAELMRRLLPEVRRRLYRQGEAGLVGTRQRAADVLDSPRCREESGA